MTLTRLLPFGIALLLIFTAREASACACCSNTGQRIVQQVELDGGRFENIQRLRFANEANLFLGESDADTVAGITTPSASYAFTAAWQDERLVFGFRDPAGHTGTLTLARPRQVAIFEIDPRDGADKGLGPLLYKEWKLTAPAAGSGVFAPGLGPGQEIALILHGRGRSCTEAEDFTHWTLEMRGPKATYSFYGALRSLTNRPR